MANTENTTDVAALLQIQISTADWEDAYGKDETPEEIRAYTLHHLTELITADFESRGLTATLTIAPAKVVR